MRTGPREAASGAGRWSPAARWLGVVVGLHLGLGLLYSWATPVFEAPDEGFHFAVIRWISQGRGLPVQEPGQASDWEQEGSQPPLYYLLAAGLVAAVLVTFLQMVNAALSAVEMLLVLVGPICLAAYALPATQRITNGWLKVLLAILVVRFAWTIAFVLFSLQALGHIGPDGNPPTVGDTNLLLGLATGCALLMFVLPFALIPAALSGPGPLRTEA